MFWSVIGIAAAILTMFSFIPQIIKVVKTKMKSLAAGKMGYSTEEVGDLVVKNL